MRDLGEQNLTLLEQGKKSAVKAGLEAVPEKSADLEVLSTGEVEGSISAPITKGPKWLQGGTVTGFAKAKVQQMKQAVFGVRVSKKF